MMGKIIINVKENNWSEKYIRYIGIDITRRKFDYCIANMELLENEYNNSDFKTLTISGIEVLTGSAISSYIEVLKDSIR